eukprot:1431582-Pyramimonas_sp.AAC.2
MLLLLPRGAVIDWGPSRGRRGRRGAPWGWGGGRSDCAATRRGDTAACCAGSAAPGADVATGVE